jgi:hypothetical protein
MREKQRFYQNPRTQNLIIIAIFLVLFIYMVFREGQIPTYRDVIRSIFYTITLQFSKIPTSMRLLAFDSLICFVGLFLWTAFFAQFVLPLRTLRERYLATERLVLFLTGEHGPAVYIENGRVQERKGETGKKGPGVILLDAASAALLRSDFSYIPPGGPGVIFTEKNLYLAKSVDLHILSSPKFTVEHFKKSPDVQSQESPKPFLGPLGNEDPFKRFDSFGEETDEEYKRRQDRRMETSGLTRDGVEAVPNIVVKFRLKYSRPWSPFTPYRFYPIAVQQWATADGPISTTGNSKWDNIPLQDLPAYMAAELWREYLQKFTLSELFLAPFQELTRGPTAYGTILKMINARLTEPTVEVLDKNGQSTRQRVISQEFIELRKRGIRVLGAGVFNLQFDPSIENKLVEQWKASWLDRAREEFALVERKRTNAALNGKTDAWVKYVRAAIQRFPEDIDDVSTYPRPANRVEELIQLRFALSTLIRGLRGEIRTDTRLSSLLQTEDTDLTDVLTRVGELD